MAEWRCSNCGSEARLKDGYLPMDSRYGLGHCGNCSLRGEVPLMLATRAEADAMVDERNDKVERQKLINGITVGRVAAHTKAKGCCPPADKKEHLTRERLDQLLAIMGVKA